MTDTTPRPSPLNAFGYKPSVCKKREQEIKKQSSNPRKSMGRSSLSENLMYIAIVGLTLTGGYFVIKKITSKKHGKRKKR